MPASKNQIDRADRAKPRRRSIRACVRSGRWCMLAGAAVLAVGPFATQSAQAVHPPYSITDLGDPTGLLGSYASNINDNGHVVVNGSPLYSWSATGGLVDIGNLGFEPANGRDINASGQIVGDSRVSDLNPYSFAFLWSPGGTMQPLGTLGGRESVALAINDSGQVVGQSETTSGETHAFSWTAAGGMIDIGTVGLQSGAVDVNNSGEVIVREFTQVPVVTTYVWSAPNVRVALPSLGGPDTIAVDINSNGAVGGHSVTSSGARHPFVWTAGGGIVDLDPTSGSFGTVTALNDVGQAAGRIFRSGGSVEHAFFWSASTGIIDLPTFGGNETEAKAINDSGQVVGYGTLAGSGDEDAFVWTQADGMLDLGLGEAGGINASGQIAGTRELPTRLRRAALFQPFDHDANNNGIDDALEVVGQPGAFADDNTPLRTQGSIVDANGHTVTITDALAPDGVRIAVTGTGTDKATFSLCGMTLKLAPGSEVVVTCGSLTVSVIAGAAEITVGGVRVVITVPQGATAKVADLGGGSYRVDNLGDNGNVTVALDGNPTTVTPHQTTTVSTGDITPPQVHCATAPSFVVGQPGVLVTASVTDSGSGPAATPVAAAADTTRVGTFTANVTGYDNAGNSTTVKCTYSVTYAFQGFSAPIDNLPTINSAKAGQTVPIKWRVTNYQGVGVADSASFTNVTTVSGNCSPTAAVDAVEAYTGNSGLQYLGNGWWQFNWKTPKTYAGLCRDLRLNLNDGTVHIAAFKFK